MPWLLYLYLSGAGVCGFLFCLVGNNITILGNFRFCPPLGEAVAKIIAERRR